jgi:hypothetical protein
MMIVANTIELLISSVASRTTSAAGRTVRRRTAWFSRRRPDDVLHVDDRIVDQRTDGDSHSAKRHGVDAGSHGRSASTAAASDKGMACKL